MTEVALHAPRVPLVDPRTGMVTPAWYRFFQGLYTRTGGPDDAIETLELGELYEPGIMPAHTAELIKRVEDLETQLAMTPDCGARIEALAKRVSDLEVQVEMLPDRGAEIDAIRKGLSDVQSELAELAESDPFQRRTTIIP